MNWKYCTQPTAERLRELGLPQGMTEVFYYRWKGSDDDWKLENCHVGGWIRADQDYETVDAPDLSEAMRVLEIGRMISVNIWQHEILDNVSGDIFAWDNKTIFPAESACRMIV